jgi:hypothetical protein
MLRRDRNEASGIVLRCNGSPMGELLFQGILRVFLQFLCITFNQVQQDTDKAIYNLKAKLKAVRR